MSGARARALAAWTLALAVLAGTAQLASHAPDGIAPLLLVVALTSGAMASPRPRERPAWQRELVVAIPILAVSARVFLPAVLDGTAGRNGDWPFHDALAETLYASLASGRGTPAWVTTISTGDPTFEMYPTAVHQLAARIALARGSVDHVHGAILAIALVAYTGAALGIARLALRFATVPAALFVGLATLLDAGMIFTWGTGGSWYWGLFPSSVAIALVAWGMPSLLDILRGHASRRGVLTLWLTLAAAALAHPITLVCVLALVIACVLGAAMSARAQRERFAMGAVHVAIGLALVAFVWLPEGRRLLEQGVHYGMGQAPLALAWERAREGLLPHGSFPPLMMLALATPLAALLARGRGALGALPWLAAAVMLVGYLDPPFLLFGLAPSPTTVRFQAPRVSIAATPLLYASAAWLLSLPARPSRDARSRRVLGVYRVVCAALAAGAAFATYAPLERALRAQLDLVDEQVHATRIPEREDLEALYAFFRSETAELEARGEQARAIYLHRPDAPNELLLIGTRSGVPVAASGDRVAMFFLREQPLDTSERTLRRFGFRWAVGDGSVSLGDPDTERRFGRFVVREITSWDGHFAHEADGTPVRSRFGDDEIVLEREGPGTALVELGTPYYGRWHALTPGASVCAQPLVPSDPRAQRALAVRAPAGRTVLRADGPLPSDRVGIPFTAVALFLAWLAWPGARRGLRARVAAWVERARPFALLLVSPATLLALGGLFVAMTLARQGAFGAPSTSLRYGGFFAPAQVTLIRDAQRTRCSVSDLVGHAHACPGDVSVRHEIVMVIEDAPVGWDSPAPGVHVVSPAGASVELVVPGRYVGNYLARCAQCSATIAIGAHTVEVPAEATVALDIPPDDVEREARVTLRAYRSDAWFAMAERRALDGDRLHDVPLCEPADQADTE